MARVSTSYVERANLSIRMQNCRFTRLTNAFSKKFQSHVHALGLYFAFYNFCRIHKTLRVAPAMAAGITDKLWTLVDIVALIYSYVGDWWSAELCRSMPTDLAPGDEYFSFEKVRRITERGFYEDPDWPL